MIGENQKQKVIWQGPLVKIYVTAWSRCYQDMFVRRVRPSPVLSPTAPAFGTDALTSRALNCLVCRASSRQHLSSTRANEKPSIQKIRGI